MEYTSKCGIFTATWINMQDAYFQEKQTVGDWGSIGYSAPGAKTNSSSYNSSVFTYTESSVSAFDWIATPKAKLNDCGDVNTEVWKLVASVKTNSSGSNDVKIADGSTAADCKILTPSWDNLLKN